MKSIFFVVRPLEFLGAIEARDYFKIKNTVLILKPEKYDINTLELLINKSRGWDNVIWMKTRSSYGWKWIKLIKKLQKENYEYLFIQGFALGGLFLHNLNYKESYILDDGTATINISKKFEENKNLTTHFSLFKGKNKTGIKYQILEKLYKSNKINIEEPVKKIAFFTYFNLHKVDNQKVVIHKFDWLNSHLNSLGELKGTVFFIGTNVVRDEIIEMKDYLATLKRVNDYYSEKKIVYIPHGSERKKEIEHIQSKLGWTIRRNKYNVEIDFILSEKNPSVVAGTISSALITLKLIYKEALQVDFFNFNEESLSPNRREDVVNILEYQKKYITYQKLKY